MQTRKVSTFICAIAVISLAVAGSADAVVSFDWATVGNPGNAPDTTIMNKGGAPDFTTGYGSVPYTYNIAKNSVTNSQYVDFLNGADPTGSNTLKIYDARMTTSPLGAAYSGGINFNAAAANGAKYSVNPAQANYPATWINWVSGARFVNWYSNGQGVGGTEDGVYDMTLSIPVRKAGATVYMPSENEYYKAAYYDPTKGGTGGYWQFGTQSDTSPVSEAPVGGANSANLRQSNGNYWQNGSSFNATVDYLTNVGSYTNAQSHYGLKDAEGGLYSWTEAFRTGFNNNLFPVYRGGSWYYDSLSSGAGHRNIYSFANSASYAWFGLRIASYGLNGDANLDGKVTTVDFNQLSGSFGQSGKLWANGDFDHTGTVDSIDFGILAGNFGKSLATSSPSLGSNVPEPTSAMVLCSLTALLLRRSRIDNSHVCNGEISRTNT